MTEPRVWAIDCETGLHDYSKYSVGDVIVCDSDPFCECVPLVWRGEHALNPKYRHKTSDVGAATALTVSPAGDHDDSGSAVHAQTPSFGDVPDGGDTGSDETFSAGGHWSDEDADEHEQSTSDDCGLLENASWWHHTASFDFPYDQEVCVPIEATSLFADPLATYQPLLGKMQGNTRGVTFEVAYGHPMHIDIQNGAARPTRWHSVRYAYRGLQCVHKTVVFARVPNQSHDVPEYLEWKHSFPPYAQVSDYDYEYRAQMTRVGLLIRPGHVPIAHSRHPQTKNGVPIVRELPLPLSYGWVVRYRSDKADRSISIYGYKSFLQHQLALLTEFFKPSQFKYAVSKDEHAFGTKVREHVLVTTRTRPLFYYTWLFGAALVLFRAVPQLGPYLLLEIVDWLPDMALLSHSGKLDYLYKIHAALRTLSEAAENKRARIC